MPDILFNFSTFPMIRTELSEEARDNDIRNMNELQDRKKLTFVSLIEKRGEGIHQKTFHQNFYEQSDENIHAINWVKQTEECA